MWTHPDARILFRASDMLLNVHSDASYLSAPKAMSRAGGYFFLGNRLPKDNEPIALNASFYVICTILKLVAISAAEAEFGALFLNAAQTKIIEIKLEELGHPQPPTPVHVNNSTTVGIVNSTIKRQKSRSMEMRYMWLLDQETQSLLTSHQNPGQENLGDYPSNHHTVNIHQHFHPYYVHMDNSPLYLPRAQQPRTRQGCVGILGDGYHGKIPLLSLRPYP